jgi:Holliday junction resolvase
MAMKESALKRKVMKLLREKYLDAWFYAPSDKFYSGIPDIIGCKNGKFFAIELKNKKGVVSKIQQYTLGQIIKAGGQSTIARSIEDVISFIDCGHCFKN